MTHRIFYLILALLFALLVGRGPVYGLPRTAATSDSVLATQIHKLADALKKRDLEAIRAQISPSRIYVEITDKPGAYLSNSQTIVVMESFMNSRSGITSNFDFVTDNGQTGSASGTLSAYENGRTVSYRLNFGFVRAAGGNWLLSRISMK